MPCSRWERPGEGWAGCSRDGVILTAPMQAAAWRAWHGDSPASSLLQSFQFFSLSAFFKPELPFSSLSAPPFSPSPQLGPSVRPFGDSLVPDAFLCECRHAARPGPSLEQSSPSAWGCASCPLPELALRPPSLVHCPGVTPRGVPALGTHADGCLRGHRGRSNRAGALPVCALCSVHACSLFLCGGFREGCRCHCRCHCRCSPPRLVAPPGRSFSSLPPPLCPPKKTA